MFGSHDKCMYRLSLNSELSWRFTTDSAFVAVMEGSMSLYSLTGEVFSSPVMFDDQILIGCRDNYLYSLEIINETEK